jgi:hypothetical protein
VTGRKAAQERFSEEKFPEPCYRFILYHRKRISQQLSRKRSQNSAKTYGIQQAWMNSRNSTTIATETKHRQPNLFTELKQTKRILNSNAQKHSEAFVSGFPSYASPLESAG